MKDTLNIIKDFTNDLAKESTQEGDLLFDEIEELKELLARMEELL